MTYKDLTIESIVARWTDPARRPLFKGSLIHMDGDTVCRCAQGDILHLAGWSDWQLADTEQSKADAEVAALLGISRAHSILLRHVNDSVDGCPQDVLVAPEKILGQHAQLVLAFWRHMDTLTAEDWRRVAAPLPARVAAWDAAEVAAVRSAGSTATDAAKVATSDAARAACSAWDTRDASYAVWNAAWASNEIQGHEIFAAQGRPLMFLPLFGLTINDLSTTQEPA